MENITILWSIISLSTEGSINFNMNITITHLGMTEALNNSVPFQIFQLPWIRYQPKEPTHQIRVRCYNYHIHKPTWFALDVLPRRAANGLLYFPDELLQRIEDGRDVVRRRGAHQDTLPHLTTSTFCTGGIAICACVGAHMWSVRTEVIHLLHISKWQ